MGFGQFFGNLADKCAKNKCIAIGFMLMITGIFAIGILSLKMETDPQNLWAPSSGRTHNEQAYFNENFGQFFRVDQIIISAGPNYVGETSVVDVTETSGARLLSSSKQSCNKPAPSANFFTESNLPLYENQANNTFYEDSFKKSETLAGTNDAATTTVPDLFTLEPLKWLYYLEKIINTRSFKKDGNDVTVDNLCYKPISNKGCLITSPMDYWKMNITLLDERAA